MLDALRGIAALIVVLFHYLHQFTTLFPNHPQAGFNFRLGQHGVLLFFAISGFVILMTLERTDRVRDFVIARFVRLFPAYWAAIVITTIIVALGNLPQLQVGPMATLVNFTMLEGFLRVPAVDGVYWTLTIELAFYAVMVTLWWLGLLRAGTEWVVAAWIGLKWLWWAEPQLSWMVGLIVIQEFIPFFAIGILAYRRWSKARTTRQQAPLLLFALITIGIVDGIDLLFVAVVVAMIFAVIAVGAWTFPTPRILSWLGLISYPLYLVHQHVGYVVIDLLETSGVGPQIAIGSALILSLIIAHSISRIIEQPAIETVRAWRRRAVQPA